MNPNLGSRRYRFSRVGRKNLLEIYRRAFLIRTFEQCAALAIKDGRITTPTYLAIGHEVPAATISVKFPQFGGIFAQHRSHSYYLAFGGSPRSLAEELMGVGPGLDFGRRGSASISSKSLNMFGHSGLMGDQVPIAVGYSLSSRQTTLAVMGDASAEEDYVLGAIGYAATRNANVLFLCEDNNLSILTPVAVRRKWSIVEVAKSFGMPAFDVADNPRFVIGALGQWSGEGPIFLNIRVCRGVWHAGAGRDDEPAWDRIELIRRELMGFAARELGEIERLCRVEVEEAWA